MRPAARSSALAASAAAALLAAGCLGGSGSTATGPTRAHYVADAKRICVAYQRRIGELKGSSTFEQLAVQGERAIELQAAEVRALRKLQPPSADAAAIGHMLETVERSIATARELVAAARSGDKAGVAAAAQKLRAQLAEANRLAKPFGLDLCAQ
jgi:hypothetical protein